LPSIHFPYHFGSFLNQFSFSTQTLKGAEYRWGFNPGP
jgi:hypothetical protein